MTDLQSWVPEACTLPTGERPLRVAEFDDLFATALRSIVRAGPLGLRLVMDPDAEATARALTDREASCCSFFTFKVEQIDEELHIDIGVPVAHVAALDALAARARAASSVSR